MPNPNHGEHDFILELEKNMDHKRMRLVFLAAQEINDIKIDLFKAQQKKDDHLISLAESNLERWTEKWKWLRRNSTFFYVASSYVAADTLPETYFKDAIENENFRDVMVSLFSMKVKLDKGQLFYPGFKKQHLFYDGYEYNRMDEIIQSGEDFEECSLDLKFIDHHAPLEAGFDSGNMCSLIVGQAQGDIQRLLKFLYTLPEGDRTGFINGLGKWFRDYFEYHHCKELSLYHDPATNKFKAVGDDHASRLKRAIEYDEKGAATGWVVTLMNESQGSISQQEEYDLMLEILEEKNPALPKLRIDGNTCKPLKGSMEMAEKIEKVNKRGEKTIHKNKTNEKTQDWQRLLHASTNPSDSMKYYLCRKEYLEVLSGQKRGFVYIPK